MKKLFIIAVTMLLAFTLTGCENVNIAPDKISVIYNDYWEEEDLLIIEVHITNGTNEVFDLGYTEFWLELPGEETEVAGASFDFDIVLKANSYVTYELEFESEQVFLTIRDLEAIDLSYSDCDLYFYFEGLE